jgi:GNAT superfamily N-acetyltransferase
VEIRELDPERDAEACVALLREVSPRVITSRAAWLHRVRSLPERAHLSNFVAEEDGRIVGESYGFHGLFGDDSVAVCMVSVTASHRRHGVGTELLRALEPRFSSTLLARFAENEPGIAFAHAHGFHEVRAETESTLDLRAVDAAPPAGVDLRPLSQTDPRHAHLVDIEATKDMPSTEEVSAMPYEDWAELVLTYPIFSAEGSFVVYVDGEPAAVSLLVADPESGRSANWFVGTRRAYRGRGLAKAAKLASIAWARAHGMTEMITDNDETNAPMLAINRALGFRPAGRRLEYLRAERASSPAPPGPAT